MKKFIEDIILHSIKTWEGGFVNHPHDPGGATNHGVTRRSWARFRNKKVSETPILEIKELSLDQALGFYQQQVWKAHNISSFPIELWEVMFDLRVNHSPRGGTLILQRALRTKLSLDETSKVDGKMGDKTLQGCFIFIDKYGHLELLNAIADKRIAYYMSLIKRDPKLKSFQTGWLRRANGFRKINVKFDNESPVRDNVIVETPVVKVTFWQRLLQMFKRS